MTEVIENWQRKLDSAKTPAEKSKTFEALLTDFPLLFGYWIQYAEHISSISGPLSAKEIYGRAVSSIPTCVTLWVSYVDFALRNPADFEPSAIQQMFLQAEEAAGRDFYSHPLWDKHIEYANSTDPSGRQTADILIRATQYPLHQYARYFEHMSNMSTTFPELISHVQRFSQIQQATNDSWVYESQITQNYFNVLPIEESTAKVWNDYLDYLETSDFEPAHVKFVYERCMVVLARYSRFWRKYFQWAFEAESEELARDVLRRGVTFTKSNSLKLVWSLFEESNGHVVAAKDILETLIDYIKSQCAAGTGSKQELVDAYTYLFNLQKRHAESPEKLSEYLDSIGNEYSYGYKARYLKDAAILAEGLEKFPGSIYLHTVKIELGESSWSDLLKSSLPPTTIQQLAPELIDKVCGQPEWIKADYETLGPLSVQSIVKEKLAADGNPETTDSRLKNENGHIGVEIKQIYGDRYEEPPFEKYLKEQSRYLNT